MVPVRDTSMLAYTEKVLPNLSTRQRQVYEIFRQFYDSNFTNAEIARELGWAINRICPRVLELRKKGMLKEECRRRCTVTGNFAYAWKLNK